MFGYFSPTNNICRCTLCDTPVKFAADNLCTETENYIILCEGYILNPEDDMPAKILELYKSDRDAFYTRFKGSYVIAVVDKASGQCTVVNDLLSKKAVYYYRDDERFVFSTYFWELYDFLKEENIPLTLNEAGIRLMLERGTMMEDITYISEIKYLMPFQAIENGCTIDLPYPEYIRDISAEAAADELDRLFLEGCRLQFEKNQSYGYEQIFSLSGGMDSKAVLLCAKRLGFSPDLCFTYAESGSDDERISRKIASDTGCRHLFFPMDGGGFLSDRKTRIERNEGMLIYSGTTGLAEVIKMIDCSKAGIVSAGIGGGEIMGDVNMQLPNEAESRNYLVRVVQLLHLQNKSLEKQLISQLLNRYSDCNLFVNLRETRVCVNFAQTARGSFEVASPFLYEDFFCYAMSLPVSMRTNRKLYRTWYDRHMSNSYETTFRPNDSADTTLTLFRRIIRKSHIILNKAVKKLRSSRPVEKTTREMNPFNYWWDTNENLRSSINAMYRSDMETLADIEPWLKNALDETFSGEFPRKLCALTVTWVLNRMNR